jgi:hypothetical protein
MRDPDFINRDHEEPTKIDDAVCVIYSKKR